MYSLIDIIKMLGTKLVIEVWPDAEDGPFVVRSDIEFEWKDSWIQRAACGHSLFEALRAYVNFFNVTYYERVRRGPLQIDLKTTMVKLGDVSFLSPERVDDVPPQEEVAGTYEIPFEEKIAQTIQEQLHRAEGADLAKVDVLTRGEIKTKLEAREPEIEIDFDNIDEGVVEVDG